MHLRADGIVAPSTKPDCPDLEISADQEMVESRTDAGNLVLGGVLNIWREKPLPRTLIFTGVFAPAGNTGAPAPGAVGGATVAVTVDEAPGLGPPRLAPLKRWSLAWGLTGQIGEHGRAFGPAVAPQWRSRKGWELELPVSAALLGDTYAVGASLLIRPPPR